MYYDSKFQRTYVLKEIVPYVKEGEFLRIMEPSGSGKSSLLNIICLLDAPSDGKYELFDKSVLKQKKKQKWITTGICEFYPRWKICPIWNPEHQVTGQEYSAKRYSPLIQLIMKYSNPICSYFEWIIWRSIYWLSSIFDLLPGFFLYEEKVFEF